jgi:hypothetical protein
MQSAFTPEELLLYLYQETTPAQTAEIEKALEADWTLREKLEVLKAARNRLEKFRLSPRTESVLNILHHAAKSQPTGPLN